MSRRALAAIILVVIALTAAGLLGARWYGTAIGPTDPTGEPEVVHIPAGSSVVQIADLLHGRALIHDTLAFRLMIRLNGLSGKLRAGHYELSPSMTAVELAERIASGEVATARITIPEGLRLTQIADRMAEIGLAGRDDFLSAAVADSVAGEIDIPLPEGTLEGYLFPETYEFRFDDGPEAMVRRMVRELQQRFYAPYREQIPRRGLSLHEIITLASLIEREAKLDAERALIAGVIQNRLDRNMKLQIDATVQYALPEHKSRLLYEDLKIDSPYNTYRHHGLPPGPIASPGLPSLIAALRPAETDALFYVARPDGSHVFSPNYDDHLQAIERIRGE